MYGHKRRKGSNPEPINSEELRSYHASLAGAMCFVPCTKGLRAAFDSIPWGGAIDISRTNIALPGLAAAAVECAGRQGQKALGLQGGGGGGALSRLGQALPRPNHQKAVERSVCLTHPISQSVSQSHFLPDRLDSFAFKPPNTCFRKLSPSLNLPQRTQPYPSRHIGLSSTLHRHRATLTLNQPGFSHLLATMAMPVQYRQPAC